VVFAMLIVIVCVQYFFNNKNCFVDICPCVVEVDGVGTSVFIYGEGTVDMLLTSSDGGSTLEY
jgi:hypothetical protein